MKIVKYDPRNARDTQQIVDLFNRNGMYLIPGVKSIRPEDWLLSYQAKEMDSCGYFMIKSDDDQVIGGIGIFKYVVHGDAPQNVFQSGGVLIDSKYRTGSVVLELSEMLPKLFSRTPGHFISEIASRNFPSLKLSKVTGYFSTPYSWTETMHHDSYESVIQAVGNAVHTNISAVQFHYLANAIAPRMVHNNVIIKSKTNDYLIEARISFFEKYPYYLKMSHFAMGRLEKKADRFYFVFRIARPGLFSALQINDGPRHPLHQQTGMIKLPAHKRTCHARFIKGDRFWDLSLQPAATPGYHRRGFSIDQKDLEDLRMSYAGFHLFFDRFNGNVYFKHHDSILLTDVFCQAYYQGPGHFKFTKNQNTLRIDMTNASYHIVKKIQFNDNQIVDTYRVLRSKREVMAKSGLLLDHQDYLMYDQGQQAYQRKVPMVDVPEYEVFLLQRFFDAQPKDYLIEHANVHLRVSAHSSSNQMGFRPLILMKITQGATLQYHYSLTKLDHSIIPADSLTSSTAQQASQSHPYQINHAVIGRVWEDEVINLKHLRHPQKILQGEKKVGPSQPVRFQVASRPAGSFRQLRFQIHSFDDPVVRFSDGRKRRLTDYMAMIETFGKVIITDHKNSLKIIAPHSWLSLYLDNNVLKVKVTCERATTVSIF